MPFKWSGLGFPKQHVKFENMLYLACQRLTKALLLPMRNTVRLLRYDC